MWWLIEGKAGSGTAIDNLPSMTFQEMEDHFFKMKKICDQIYNSQDENFEDHNPYLPKRMIYLDQAGGVPIIDDDFFNNYEECQCYTLYQRLDPLDLTTPFKLIEFNFLHTHPLDPKNSMPSHAKKMAY